MKDRVELRKQLRNIIRDDRPNDREIDAGIAVDEAVPKAEELWLGNLRITLAHRWAEAGSGFTDDFQQTDQCQVQELVCTKVFEGLARAECMDLSGIVTDLLKGYLIVTARHRDRKPRTRLHHGSTG